MTHARIVITAAMCGQIVQVDKKLHVDFYLVFDLFDSSYTPGKATVQERGKRAPTCRLQRVRHLLSQNGKYQGVWKNWILLRRCSSVEQTAASCARGGPELQAIQQTKTLTIYPVCSVMRLCMLLKSRARRACCIAGRWWC